MPFGLGAHRSHPDKLAARPDACTHPAIGAVRASGAPASASLQASESVRLNQGQSSACTAHSMAAAIAAMLAHAGKALGFVPSPKAIYALTRAIERGMATATTDALPALQDSGANLADVVAAIAAYGICPMGGPTPDGRTSDVWTIVDTAGVSSNIADEPDLAAMQVSATRLLTGPYAIQPSQLDVAAAAIAAGFPIYVAFFCDSGFQALTASSPPYGAPNQADPSGGGHAVFVDAYRTNADGTRSWRLVNSWGTDWADNGACWVSDAFMAACWELWVLDLKEAA